MTEDQFPSDQPFSKANRKLLVEAVEKGEIADYQKREVVRDVDRESLLLAEPVQVVDAEDIREMMTGVSRRGNTNLPKVTSAGVRIYGATITGTLDLDDATGPERSAMPRLEVIGCWFKNPIEIGRSRLRSLCLRSCRFDELQASETVIEGPVDISRARSTQDPKINPHGQCWVVLAGAEIGGRINVAHSKLAAPPSRKPEEWVLYSKHSRYALDLRGTRIRGSINLRPNLDAWGGVCLTLAKVEGSVWANGAYFEGVEDSAFAADYAEIQGSLYFRPYDSPAKPEDQEKKINGRLVARSADFRAFGEISLFASKIGGSLYFEGAKLKALDPANRETRPQRNSVVNAATAAIGGSCLFRSWRSELYKEGDEVVDPKLVRYFYGDGAIDFTAASIGNDLDFNGAVVRSITATNARVSGSCKLTTYRLRNVREPRPFRAMYFVNFVGATILGNLDMNEARIGISSHEPTNFEEINPAASIIDTHQMEGESEVLPNLVETDNKTITHLATMGLLKGVYASGINVGGTCTMGITGREDSQFHFECLGRIDMAEGKFNNSFRMDGAWVIGPADKTTLDLSGITVGNKATFMTWDKNRPIGGQVFKLRGGETGIKLNGARIGQELLMNGAQIRAKKTALIAENIKVGGKAALGTYESMSSNPGKTYSFVTWGKVSLVSANISLGLDMSGAQLNSITLLNAKNETTLSDALDLTRLCANYVRLCAYGVTKDSVYVPFSAGGRVSLEHADIDTFLNFKGSRFDRQLSIEYAKVGGAVELENISLTSTYARENINEEVARKAFILRSAVSDLSLRGASICGPLKVENMSVDLPAGSLAKKPCLHFAAVDLRNAHAGELDDRGGTGWGEHLRFWLEGLRYARLPDSDTVDPIPAPSIWHPRRLLDPSWLPDLPHKHGVMPVDQRKRGGLWRQRAVWLRLQYFDHNTRRAYEFSPDAYEQVVKGMNETGSYEDARRISSIRLTLDRENGPRRLGFISTFFRVFFDYGFSVHRALTTFAFFLVLGTCAAWIANYGLPWKDEQARISERVLIINTSAPDAKLRSSGTDKHIYTSPEIDPVAPDDIASDSKEKYLSATTPCGDHVQSFLYALDVFIPVLDLRQQDACSIAPGARLWKVSQATYAAFGWIITSLVVLTYSGLLRKHLER